MKKTVLKIDDDLNISFSGSKKDADNFIDMCQKACKTSPTFKKLLKKAADNNCFFKFLISENVGFFNPNKNFIAINPLLENKGNQISVLSHELRHADQHYSGFLLNERGKLNVKSEIINHRFTEADAQVMAVKCAVEMHKNGFSDSYNYFKETWAEVINPYLKAKENKEMAAFKGYYDNQGLKAFYCRCYIVEPMQQLVFSEKDMVKYPFNKKVNPEQFVRNLKKTVGGNYFTESPKILTTQNFLEVSKFQLDIMKRYFEHRENVIGMKKDNSVNEIPEMPFTCDIKKQDKKTALVKKDNSR